MQSSMNPLGWPAWAWRCFVALALVMAAYSVAESTSNFARSANILRDIGPPGATYSQPPGTPSGWYRVDDIWEVGPARAAGLRPGDLVQFDGPTGPAAYQLRNRSTWPHPVTVERDGREFRAQLVVPALPLDGGSRFIFALFGIQSGIAVALGLLLLIRGRSSRAATMLATILMALAALAGSMPPWIPNVETAWLVLPLIMLPAVTISYFWPQFSLEVSGGATNRREGRFVHTTSFAFAAVFIGLGVMGSLSVTIPLIGSPAPLAVSLIAANQVFGYAIIARGYRRNDAPARNRIRIVVLAFFCFLLSTVLGLVAENLLNSGASPSTVVWLKGGLAALSSAGLFLLVYAVLRRSLFDLNFALNRTLVYAMVSFVVLAAFGLAKWAIEHLIPESWHTGSEYYSVGIALVLFLILHRVHDWVERNVERFLFSPWHRNEESLRRFVTAAGHFDQTPVLCRAFVEELSRFAKGAGAALYLRGRQGSYALGCGTLEGTRSEYAGDDLVLALMRAERRPVRIGEMPTALPGVLALPMLDHGKLSGFVLLDGKPDATDYRPDEVELLGWAAHQVGLDLQAMHAGELEAEVAGLHAKVAALSAQLSAASARRKRATAA